MCNGNCKNCGNCNGNCGKYQRGFVYKEESSMKVMSKNEIADIFYDLSKMCLIGTIVDTLELPVQLGLLNAPKILEIVDGLHDNFAEDCRKTLEGYGLSTHQTVQELINEVKVVNTETDAPNKIFSKDDFCEILHKLAGASLTANLIESLCVAAKFISIEPEEVLEVLMDIHNDMMEDVNHTLREKHGIDTDDMTIGGLLNIVVVKEDK